MKKTPRSHYIPGLDGLRAFAVLAVIAYHFNFSWATGGFLGVNLFFVLSGYLITSTLLPDKNQPFKLNLSKFWLGRARRLLPASYAMIFVTFVWVVLFNQELLTTVRSDAIASIFYASNWWFIFHDVSYFDSFGAPSPLKNLWSLAIEEQFYLLWPLVLAAGFYLFKKRSTLTKLIFISAIASALLMAILYQPGADPSRVYYGTDTRSFELLIGCWLALVWPMRRLSVKKVSSRLSFNLNLSSFAAVGILILCIAFVDEYDAFLYRGGMFLIALIAAVLIACVCHPASLLGKWLSWEPLKWIGSRSYGIYLWHYPIIVLTTPVHELGTPVLWRVAIQLTATFIIAELSYRYIEQPIRKEGFKEFFKKYKSIDPLKWKTFSLNRKIAATFLPLVFLIFIAGMTGVVKGEESKSDRPTEVVINQENQILKDDLPKKETAEKELPLEKNEPLPEEEPEQVERTEEPEEEFTTATDYYSGFLAIGDSVMLDIASSMQEKFPNITIDAKVGRQVYEAIQIAPNYAQYNQPNHAVILMLGTNGYFTDENLDILLQSFSSADIYLVNTRVPRPWESKVNDSLFEKAEENDHITLIDWHSEGMNHPEYFGSDGVHVGPTGIKALTNLIEKSMDESVNK
ncbi:acyltransferase family protein [Cytobacillus purgationiresistens]|uniref:Peptidoglycan/LPS O-acetylase OafA/YrhL n=1 Tax=Cytobacillus purgationiresistens TaxID=863449 RepID=A0ABU0APU8_9BACI|nr:acyltransferase family protein [Cytobacillus purgationiresistens]MDQ0272781.1 peptidoglycan/LPS O-acetylase OafA/YrhL [Cytobacillus purgationiresistens]